MAKYSKEYIKEKLRTNRRWLEKGVVSIFNCQTNDEQVSRRTTHRNNMGFSAADAGYLSYVAKYLIDGGRLSGYHLENTRKKMLKYAGQLERIANKG